MEKIITPIKGPDKGRVKGKVLIDDNGDKRLYDAYGNVLAKYNSSKNFTTDSHGIPIMQGDGLNKMRSCLEVLLEEKRKLNS